MSLQFSIPRNLIPVPAISPFLLKKKKTFIIQPKPVQCSKRVGKKKNRPQTEKEKKRKRRTTFFLSSRDVDGVEWKQQGTGHLPHGDPNKTIFSTANRLDEERRLGYVLIMPGLFLLFLVLSGLMFALRYYPQASSFLLEKKKTIFIVFASFVAWWMKALLLTESKVKRIRRLRLIREVDSWTFSHAFKNEN